MGLVSHHIMSVSIKTFSFFSCVFVCYYLTETGPLMCCQVLQIKKKIREGQKVVINLFSLCNGWGWGGVGGSGVMTCERSVEAGQHSGKRPCFYTTSVSASCPAAISKPPPRPHIHPPPVYTLMDQRGVVGQEVSINKHQAKPSSVSLKSYFHLSSPPAKPARMDSSVTE